MLALAGAGSFDPTLDEDPNNPFYTQWVRAEAGEGWPGGTLSVDPAKKAQTSTNALCTAPNTSSNAVQRKRHTHYVLAALGAG